MPMSAKHARNVWNAQNVRFACLVGAVLVQLAVALSLVSYTARVRQDAQKHGRIVSLACRASDPFNPFKGRYVRLSFCIADGFPIAEEAGTAAMVRENQGRLRNLPAYCRLEAESDAADAVWKVTAFRSSLPADDGKVYLRAKVSYSGYSESLQPSFNFREYYLQEDYARYVDRIHWDDFNALEPILSLYVDGKGRCVQKGLSVCDGGERISIEEYCRRKIKEQR